MAVVIEADEAETSSETGTDTGPGDGDGDSDPGDGDGDENGDGDGDGDGEPESFRVVVLGDCHIPGTLEAEADPSLATARERLIETRDLIATIDPPPAFVVVLGDMVHEAYVEDDLLWFQTNPNAFADVADIFSGLPMPVYPVFGDTDYDVPDASHDFSHLLFENYFAAEPHSSVDHLGWRFVFANSQLGASFDPGTTTFNPAVGSFGPSQLGWIAEQLSADMPTVLFSHFPLHATLAMETVDGTYPDLPTLLQQDFGSLALVLSGHEHQWSDIPEKHPAPHIVVGATYIDSDNFLLLEFTSHAQEYEILDYAKVHWDSKEADTWVYNGVPTPSP